MEALVFTDDSYTVAIESYIDTDKIEFIQTVGSGLYPEATSATIQMINGILSVVVSDVNSFVSSPNSITIDAFDPTLEVVFTTHVSKHLVVQAEKFVNTSADENYDNLVILHFVSGTSLLTTIDFTQIPTLFPSLI